MLVTDEHTEHYLALKAGGDTDRGIVTGVMAGTVSVVFPFFALIFAIKGEWNGVVISLSFVIAFFVLPFLWETLRPLPLPILFNRRTREVYYDHAGLLYHAPWDGIQALACEFVMVGPHTGGMRNASLEILVRRLGEPDNALLVSLGLPMGKTLQMQKGFWEWLRAYMDNGPWFDENGQRSDSDAFVKEVLKATNLKPTDWHKTTLADISEKKAKSGGRNYLEWQDAAMLFFEVFFYPSSWLQVFTYNIAKRRSRNRWPQIVAERLQANGPMTRLIDLERERGLDM
ncbi:hypothetical protein D9M69_496730 [compost metagenome]